MFELAKTDDGVSFCKLEHAFELDKLKIGEFSYFRKYLGMSNYLSNFQSWLKRPTVVLVLAIVDNTVVAWSMNEKWSSPSNDGRPVYVLRGIEVSPQLARQGMGKNMFFLISGILPGHIITKPVNKTAKLFFQSLGFTEPAMSSPVNLSDYPGYLVFEEDRKESLSYDDVSLLEENIRSCKTKLFPREISLESTKKDIATSLPDQSDEAVAADESTLQAPDQPQDTGGAEDAESQGPMVFDGKFIGEQKMMSPCKCKYYVVYKYQVAGKRRGTAFICAQCHLERYFLPLKK